MIIVAFCYTPVCATPVRFAFAFAWRFGQLFGRTDLRYLNLVVILIGMESDHGAIGACNEKIPHGDRCAFAIGAAKMQRNMPSFVGITSKYWKANNADNALNRLGTQD